MRNLPIPSDENSDPYDPKAVFEICVSMVRNVADRKKLADIASTIDKSSKDYDVKAAGKKLYELKVHDKVGSVSNKELIAVYSLRMAKKNARGRPIYDRILSAPAYRRCPYCGIGTVNTLDHFLPKAHFPSFVVAPNNLIPSCEWCQGEKGEYYSISEDLQLLHPYFDHLPGIWLGAEVIETTPAAFRYFSDPPATWSVTEKSRANKYIEKLNLKLLFSSNAGGRLSEIRSRLNNLHQSGGAAAVKAHLEEELKSLEEDNPNSWSSAMYRAGIKSEWFCNGGFLPT
ncbi:HNH endonuclease [Herbaspirillum robiniae]|uniref:HNH endonuclease n=1 Tax=Herbaspirillum robiniae TaxID=2014887 RepID=UPI003D7805DB